MKAFKRACAAVCALTILLACVFAVGCSIRDKAYEVKFITGEHVAVYAYESENYASDPALTSVAYSRNGSTGKLVKDGSGQVDFLLAFDAGYALDSISVTNGYNDLLGPTQTGQADVYRITGITADLRVTVTAKHALNLPRFGSQTDNDGAIAFTWKQNDSVARVDVAVAAEGVNDTSTVSSGSFTYRLAQNKLYNFTFTPYDADGSAGEAVACTRLYAPDLPQVARVEIDTEDGVFPDCDRIDAPEGCVGVSITNADYVKSAVRVYGKDGQLNYDSSTVDSSDSYGAKIKARGNTSALGEKKPYKIKLGKKSDLLAGLVENRGDKSYADKNWVLLNSAYSLNTTIGWSVSQTLRMDYTPSYAYVAVFVNGDYRGMYLLAENVKEGNGSGDKQSRCAVDEDGFIVEMDAYWWKEDMYFTTPFTEVNSMKYTFKYPDTDDITEQSPQYLYIKRYITDFEQALRKRNDSYLDYVDVDTFAKWLLAHDLLGTLDCGGANIYFTKKDSANSKLRMSVLWDFDSIMRVENTQRATILSLDGVYFATLVKKDSFVTAYKNALNEYGDSIVGDLNATFNSIGSAQYDALLNAERKRWHAQCDGADVQKSAAIAWFTSRVSWLESSFK